MAKIIRKRVPCFSNKKFKRPSALTTALSSSQSWLYFGAQDPLSRFHFVYIIYTVTHTHAGMHHAHMHARMHTHAHMQTRKHARAHTHTHRHTTAFKI